MVIDKDSPIAEMEIFGHPPAHPFLEIDPVVISDLKWTSGELRHVYEILVNGMMGDPKKLADGLISPQIETLERIVATLEGSGPAQS